MPEPTMTKVPVTQEKSYPGRDVFVLFSWGRSRFAREVMLEDPEDIH
jgi:hypothetical protein